MDALQTSTLILAVVGAVLGVLNTWRTFSMDRVRVRVRSQYAMRLPEGYEMLSIEVVNLSNFPVTISQIVVALANGKEGHLPLMFLGIAGQLPTRLESRAGFTAYARPGATEDPAFAQARAIRVRTACGAEIESSTGLATALHNLSLARK